MTLESAVLKLEACRTWSEFEAASGNAERRLKLSKGVTPADWAAWGQVKREHATRCARSLEV
jgi:hypothetical protein